ncbi:putative dehydrogenase [Bradyrhizobium sp. AZCC 1719]
MNQPLRIGLVGAGMVSRHHFIAWASISDQARIEDCYRLSGWEALR